MTERGKRDETIPPTVPAARSAMKVCDVEQVMQRVRLELYRDNLPGALEILAAAYKVFPSPVYTCQIARIRTWLEPLERREIYAATYERYYRRVKQVWGLKWLEREIRVRSGRKAWRVVERHARHPEFVRLEREVRAVGARHVLDAGCGEGRVAMTLAARQPTVQVEGLEVSVTNVRIAKRVNRFPDVAFHHGLIEDACQIFGANMFDLVWAFGVLEHVWDLDEALTALLKVLRPGGRLCLAVPMNEFRATGPLPEFEPEDAACHVRAFTESGLSERFGRFERFTLEKLPGEWRPGRYPVTIAPVEFGSYFVAVTKS
jgi:SAM-dependent methyltransferase